MIDKILQWCGIVFGIVGVTCLFLEAIGSIRKHNNTKLSILSLVFLTVSLVGYIVTELVLRSQGLPSFFSVVWVVFLWAYLICNLVSYLKINKKNRALKREKKQKEAALQTEVEIQSVTSDGTADKSADTEQVEVLLPQDTEQVSKNAVADEQQTVEQPEEQVSAKKRNSNKNKNKKSTDKK